MMPKIIYKYRVHVEPERPYRMYRIAIEHVRRRHLQEPIPIFFFKKHLFAEKKLEKCKILVDVINVWDDMESREVEYKVVLNFQKGINASKLEFYKVERLNRSHLFLKMIVFALENPFVIRTVSLQRYLSGPAGNPKYLGGRKAIWQGQKQNGSFYSERIKLMKPYNCLELLSAMTGCPVEKSLALGERERAKFSSLLKGLWMVCEGPKMVKTTFRFNRFTKESALDYRLNISGSGETKKMSVVDYFSTEKGYQIKYPNLPCLIIGSLALPLELCAIEQGQVVKRKLHEHKLRESEHQTACVPQYQGKIFKYVLAKEDALSVNRYVENNKLDHWGLINLDKRTRQDSVWKLGEEIMNKGQELGMEVSDPEFSFTVTGKDLEMSLRELLDKISLDITQMVVIIIPLSEEVHSLVKYITKVEVGMLTQCVKANTAYSVRESAITEILIKMNLKLNGTNHIITPSLWPKLFAKPVMVMGADLHCEMKATNLPSIAGVAASFDPVASRYHVAWRVQTQKIKFIQDLKEIAMEQLMQFYKNTNGLKPRAIVVFRNTDKSNQYQKILLRKESGAIRDACRCMEIDYEPKIDFYFVKKGWTYPRVRVDIKGSLIDSQIIPPFSVNGYCRQISQVRREPSKCSQLLGETGSSEISCCQVCHYLCHLAPRAAAYPAPTFAAHRFITSVKKLIFQEKLNAEKLDPGHMMMLKNNVLKDLRKKYPLYHY